MPDTTLPASATSVRVAIIGGGPAGLMAAETLARHGILADVYDSMPSVGRKFLLAGRGGLNLTHSEPSERFNQRFGNRSSTVASWLQHLDAQALREWAHGLGIETFVGTSGRVFPLEMKAAPLLRAWLSRLRAAGVRFHMRHRWMGWAAGETASPQTLRFETPHGTLSVQADAAILALGGASWARLGSDGSWVAGLLEHHIDVAPLRPANCGFEADWSAHLRERYAGTPLKSVAMALDRNGEPGTWRRGEFMLTESGIEGSLVYALSAGLRDAIDAQGSTFAWVDLLPDLSADKVLAQVSHPRGARSMASHLQSRLGLKGVKTALLRECTDAQDWQDMALLARRIKALPLRLLRTRPIDEAISNAGGVRLEATDSALMLHNAPGVFCAGEMLDWEAPTGGYLLTASMASGVVAAEGVRARLVP
ncbi:TIGR03862 family flavoprotein [Bordetella genomosp. 4]|uniref:Aminoacetone oxidase family FAD-binding enzyme n=1 Tax=Bordetella genomosp. 4 TaxID=463044 RepID=A0A261U694_9BORD|nr:TIGR03862 family flavoprotein [Bordetella genomosp. 4]OZI51238.1 aminoacetone oxidase family FAD-binding enzyme [Bordetella genomosp. 4]OZI57429.1 aminoacetone oxidase family FAD-binding enzyme [Bordetella genomosp. 4]